jgi:hypothetical protein
LQSNQPMARILDPEPRTPNPHPKSEFKPSKGWGFSAPLWPRPPPLTWWLASSVRLRPSATATSVPSLETATAPRSEARRKRLGRREGSAAAGLGAVF